MNFDWKPVFTGSNGTSNVAWEGSGVLHFGDPAGELTLARTATVIAPLAHYGLIACDGADAKDFLHGQLTSDVNHLAPGRAQYAGWCTAKGRMLASFLVTHIPSQGYLLRLSSELAAPVAKRLKMFVLRAKAAITEASESRALVGLAGPDAEAVLRAAALPVPADVLEVAMDGGIGVVRVDQARFEILVPAAVASNVWNRLAAHAAPVGTAAWRWLEVRAGIPVVTVATQEEFVPQMVNFDKIGGVSFNKGCYPGQEVIARTRYLGKVKRHLYRIVAEADMEAGAALFSEASPEQACGIVVNAASAPGGVVEALAVLQENAIGTAVRLRAPDGPAVSDISLVAN